MSRYNNMRVTHGAERGGYTVKYTRVWDGYRDVPRPSDGYMLGHEKADFVRDVEGGDTDIDDLLERIDTQLANVPDPSAPNRPAGNEAEPDDTPLTPTKPERARSEMGVVIGLGRTAATPLSPAHDEGPPLAA